MRNIFLLPTDKPSRLYEFGGEYHLQIKSQENFRSQHIYITSEKEIKEGDWVLNTNTNSIAKYTGHGSMDWWVKIILTTDPDLIKDGIQAIDDEFLEWFIKNPSCEEVDIESMGFNEVPCIIYKIIIPKEEPKQETLEGVVLSNGYNKQGYGYRKIMENNTHWITLFTSGGFQMYAYYTDDEEMEKIYDTGVVEKITPKELEVLIRVLVVD